MDHADSVISSSFHGNVFSFLFHKQLFTVLPKGEPKNPRTISLLQGIDLLDRFFMDKTLLDTLFNPIDWSVADCLISEKCLGSIAYFQSIIDRTI